MRRTHHSLLDNSVDLTSKLNLALPTDVPSPTISKSTPLATTVSTASSSPSPSSEGSAGISQSDKIALGVGLSMGLLAAGIGLAGLWFSWRQQKWWFAPSRLID